MKFDLENLNPGAWFMFDENNPADGRIRLRVCNGEALAKAQKATTKRVKEYRNGRAFERVETDNERFEAMLWDYSIVEWEGVVDADGNPIERTAENIAKLMRGSVPFARFVADALERLNRDESAYREESEKN